MSGALIMVWAGSTASLRAHEADLAGWARSRERAIELPLAEPELPPAGHDDAAADRIEGLLAEARTQAYSSNAEQAEAALDSADALVRASPELPESAWLAVEILHERALVVASRDPSGSVAYERRAAALGGARAAEFATAKPVSRPSSRPEPPAREEPTGENAPAPESTPSVMPLDGPLPTDEVDVDGVEVPVPRTIPDGAHHVRVLRRERLAWAGWITPDQGSAHVPVPLPMPCTATDLSPAATDRSRESILCEDYARARPAGAERIEVSLCHRGSCGVWLPWSRAWGAEFEGPMHPPPRPRSTSAWMPWTVAGVAAVIIGGFVLAEEGVFERQGATRRTFTFVPPK